MQKDKVRVAFECSAEQKARYVDLAFASRMTLSEWVRYTLDVAEVKNRCFMGTVPLTAEGVPPKEGGSK